MTGIPEYKLAKLLDLAVKPFIPDKYILQYSTDFKEKLHQFKFKPNQILVSFDVNSLFTNVPLNETINFIAKKFMRETVDEALKPPIKKISVKLLKFANQDMSIIHIGIFIYSYNIHVHSYKDKVFLKVDGVAMSSPLGDTMAKFFLADLQTRLLQQTLNCSPESYCRYVDCIFAVFDKDCSCAEFLI